MKLLPFIATGALAILPAAAGGVLAAEPPEGIRIGRTLLAPSLQMELSEDDNLFQRAENPVSARTLRAGPIFDWIVPFGRSRWDLAYAPRYESYSDNLLEPFVAHDLRSTLDIRLPNRMAFGMVNGYENGVQKIGQFTGGEVTLSANRYTRRTISLAAGIPFTRRQGVEFGLFAGDLRFGRNSQAAFSDYSDSGGSLGWALAVTGDLIYRIEARGSGSSQDRRPLTVTDLSTGEPVLITDFFERISEDGLIRTGFEGRLGAHLETKTFVGYEALVFPNSAQSDYRGHILESDLLLHAGPAWDFGLQLTRLPQASFFNVANYFVRESAEVAVTWKTPRRLRVTVSALRQDNSYRDPIETDLDHNPNTGVDLAGNDVAPDPAHGFVAGVMRSDRLEQLSARVEFVFLIRRLSTYVELMDERRMSNVDLFDFDSRSINLGVRFGWLPSGGGGI